MSTIRENPAALPYSRKVRLQESHFGTVRGRGELALLAEIRERAAHASRGRNGGLRLGIGDDCALVAPRQGEELAVTTDLSIAGRHFRLDWHQPEAVGHRALARGLSDLAAMGARPVAAFLSLGLPASLTVAHGRRPGGLRPGSSSRLEFRLETRLESRLESRAKPRIESQIESRLEFRAKSWVERFFDGFLALAEAHSTPLAGGDLAESPLAVADIVLVGAVPRGRALLRSGAKPGDLLYVTGALGGASAGLARLGKLAEARSGSLNPPRIPKKLEAELAPHLFPQPRLRQGLWLQRHGLASAALDVSDGLSTDLAHLCQESGVAAEVDAALVPIHPAATLDQALHGGEDYELLFSAPATARLPRSIASVKITRIGRIVKARRGETALTLLTPQGAQPLAPHGWEHFS
jgi:thiamine-monophosphate kinase